MSTCTQWVDQGVIGCKQWTDTWVSACTSWADAGSKTCTKWADEGSSECSNWADEGSNECSAWSEKHCHWYSPWNCIAGWFCQAYYWVAKWVCKAWYWVAKWVCKAFMWISKWVCKIVGWIVKAVCTIVSWIAKLVCVAWDTLRCAAIWLGKAIASLFTRSGARPKIEHVFVLMLENRSFDHMLGFSPIQATDIETGVVRGFNGLIGGTFTNIHPVTNLPVAPTPDAPFQLPGDEDDPPHEFEGALHQLCGAGVVFSPLMPYPLISNSGFLASYAGATSTPETLFACYPHDRGNEKLPVISFLARHFAVCDNWFSSLPGPTFPNRFFALAASSGGLDDSPSEAMLVAASTLDGFRFENGNIFDRLDGNCLDWTIFEGDEFPVSFALSGMNLNALQGRFKDFSEFKEEINDTGFSSRFIFIEPRYGEGDYSAVTGLDKYRCGNSMHPLNDVTRGERLIKEVYETIRNSPLWNRSVLIITFDEHGGFVDHVHPPAGTPPGDAQTPGYVKHGFKFDQLGPRVPALVISPLTPKNTVDGRQYDHTSILATLERLFGMSPLTNRDAGALDLMGLFKLPTPRTDTPTELPDPAESGIFCDDDEHRTGELQEGLRGSRKALIDGTGADVDRMKARKATPMQLGFAHIALRRLRMSQTKERRALWLQRFAEIETEFDFVVFMTEAKLALRFNEDLADERRPTPPPRRDPGRRARKA